MSAPHPTPEQHRSLLLEIIAEMTPEQLHEALTTDLAAELRSIKIEVELAPRKPSLDMLYGPTMVRNPYLIPASL
jgi:hypothetical protein